MKAALSIIVLLLLIAAVAGAYVLRGGEYLMFLLALAMVTFFGALPVVLGVLTRRAERDHTGAERRGDEAGEAGQVGQADEVIAWRSGDPSAAITQGRLHAGGGEADAGARTGPAPSP